ncbi:MAG: ABC transporter substrate-binding protein [Bacillota bacterium]|nr:ABC transporter substrate-binding protein [Bacillota bacterium]
MTGCKKSENYANSLDKVQKTKTMVIGVDDTYPPMEYRDDSNNLVGFDVDVANAVAQKMGVKIEWKSTAWDGIFGALSAKRFDLIQSSVSITPDREKTMIFTDQYITGGTAIYVKKGTSNIKTSDDLKGKVVGVQANTTADEVITKLGTTKDIKKYQGMTDAFLDLQNGRIEAVVSDPMVGNYYASKQPDKFDTPKSNLTEEPIGVAFRKEDTALRDAYNKAMADLKADGTLTSISKKWFGTDIYQK